MKAAIILSLLLASCSLLFSADRVALVVGNSRYTNLPATQQLLSPVADAQDVAGALRALGYALVNEGPITDADKNTFLTATEKFAVLAKNADAAVFYYSGHGVQVGEDNYLLPSDAPELTAVSVLKNRGVLLRDSVMVALEEAEAKTKIIILDCCRDNPFAAQLDAALAGTTKSMKTRSVGEIRGYGPDFYLAFATCPGFTAEDGNGRRNSPFTAAMIKAMPTGAAKDIDFFFRDVKAILGEDQVSWTNHSLRSTFALAAGVVPPLPIVPDAPAPATPTAPPVNAANPPPRAAAPTRNRPPSTGASRSSAPRTVKATPPAAPVPAKQVQQSPVSSSIKTKQVSSKEVSTGKTSVDDNKRRTGDKILFKK